MTQSLTDTMHFAAPPAPGQWAEVAPDLLWAKIPLPFQLDHVNVYAIRGAAAWTLVDTGIDDERTRGLWVQLIGDLAGRVDRLVVTHAHPDHVGLAGWLCAEFGLELMMARDEYLSLRSLLEAPDPELRAQREAELAELGFVGDERAALLGHGNTARRFICRPPGGMVRLQDGDRLEIGRYRFELCVFGGHSVELVTLLDAAAGIFLSADQVLARISPNISLPYFEPHADPLAEFLASLQVLAQRLTPGMLVLPGHGLPFRQAGNRIAALLAHHRDRLEAVRLECQAGALSLPDILPLIFDRALSLEQLPFAAGEARAHINWLVHAGQLVEVRQGHIRAWHAARADQPPA